MANPFRLVRTLFALSVALMTLLPPLSAAPVRPLVLLFPVVVAKSTTKTDVDAATDLAMRAAEAVRDRLGDSGIVDTLIFVPASPTFQRALKEAHLPLTLTGTPTEDERFAIGKAVGANYLVLVLSPPVSAGTDVQIESVEVATRREWKDRAHADVSLAPVVNVGGSVARYNSGINSAANTSVQRFLGGPLRDFNKASLSPALAPPPLPTAQEVLPTEIEIPDANAEAKAVREQGEALLAAGDISGAIIMLRRAVSRTPVAAAPRAALTRAYLAAHRAADAASEAKRGLMVLPVTDRAGRVEMTRLLSESLNQSGDPSAARTAYEQIVTAQPNALWARFALADLYLSQSRPDQAEAQYREIRRADPQNREALEGLAKILGERGDYSNAVKELAGKNASPVARYEAARTLFDDGTRHLAESATRNRRAWENNNLSREIFYKATQAEAQRANSLLALLRAASPPASNPEPQRKAYRQRILAGSLLLQSLASLLSFLETGEVGSGTKAALLLTEFQKELTQARADLVDENKG